MVATSEVGVVEGQSSDTKAQNYDPASVLERALPASSAAVVATASVVLVGIDSARDDLPAGP